MARTSNLQNYYPAPLTFEITIDEAFGNDATADGSTSLPFASFNAAWDYVIRLNQRYNNIVFRVLGDITIVTENDYSFEGISAKNISIRFDYDVDVNYATTDLWTFDDISNSTRFSIFAFDEGFSGILARINGGFNFKTCQEVSLSTLEVTNGNVFFNGINNLSIRRDLSSPFFPIETQFIDSTVFIRNCGPDMEFSPHLIDDSRVEFSGCYGRGFIQGDIRISGTAPVDIEPYFKLEYCSGLEFSDNFLEIESTILNRPLISFRDCERCTFAPDAVTNESGGPVVLGYAGTEYFVEILRSSINWSPLSFATSMFDSSGNNNGLKIDASSSVTNTWRVGGNSVLALEFTVPQVNDIAPGTMIDEIPRYTSYIDDAAAGVGGLTTGQPYINTTIGAISVKS